MNKNFKIFLGLSYLIILMIFLYYVFSYLQINRLDDFSYYKELQASIENFITENMIINIIFFSLFCIIWIFLLGFGSPITLASGILFGKWIGTIVSLISVCLGALLLYTITDFFFKDLIKQYLEKNLGNIFQLLKKMSSFIILFIDLLEV